MRISARILAFTSDCSKLQTLLQKLFFKQKKQFMAKGMIFHNAAFVQCYNPTCCLIIETINQLLTLLPLARKHATPDFSFVDSFKSKSIHGWSLLPTICSTTTCFCWQSATDGSHLSNLLLFIRLPGIWTLTMKRSRSWLRKSTQVGACLWYHVNDWCESEILNSIRWSWCCIHKNDIVH